MAQKRKARELSVTAAVQLTPNMRRLTLHGEELASFPDDVEGSYFKLVFPGEDPEKPVLRTYTVAKYRQDLREMDVDFMLHTCPDGTVGGVAAPWAIQVQLSDKIGIFGPGPATFINADADWYLLAADMTALPALVATLGRLPADAKGYIIIEIIADEDRQELPIPTGIELIWVVNPNPGSDDSPLFLAIKELAWLEGTVAVWAACEFKTMKKTRQYFKQDRNVEKSHLYISSYWKKGLQEEEHKIAKRDDAA
ncbi:MAG: NADPH-dependent ferric siderophore reductase [Granulosicoccus sp.]|jgi:NADPH-dependent ferric siderophore reductase